MLDLFGMPNGTKTTNQLAYTNVNDFPIGSMIYAYGTVTNMTFNGWVWTFGLSASTKFQVGFSSENALVTRTNISGSWTLWSAH